MIRRITRRHFMAGVGGASVALPLMHSLNRESHAKDAAFPKRFIVVYIPNGNIEMPVGMDFAGSIMEPLTPFKEKMILLSGLDLSVHDLPPGEPHQQGMAWLTGRPLNPGNQAGGDGSLAGWGSGVSIDQEIANIVGDDTPMRSLQIGVQSTAYRGTEVRTVISYKGSDLPNSNETSPYELFKTVFSELGADPLGLEKLRRRRHSVLDAVDKQYAALALSPRLGAEDKLKLEQHLTSIREVEMRLDNQGGQIGGSCQVPAVGDQIDLNSPASYPAIGKLQMDLLVMALRCDQTRVATLQWSASTNNKPYPYLMYDAGNGPKPIAGDEHVMGHQPDSDVHAWGALRVIRRWYMEQFAYLLNALESTPEGDGTMLDHSVVLLGSEIARGNTHSHSDAPFLLAGSAGGYFRTGQHLSFEGKTPHNNLLVSLAQSMGVDTNTFGMPEYCSGALPGLTI